MKKNILKITVLLFALIIVFSNISVFGAGVKDVFTGNTGEVSNAVSATKTIVGTILDVVRMVGIGIALIILTYIGIKVMMASPSERANIKQYAINYVIGAFILLGGVSLLTIIKNFAVTIGE